MRIFLAIDGKVLIDSYYFTFLGLGGLSYYLVVIVYYSLTGNWVEWFRVQLGCMVTGSPMHGFAVSFGST